MEEVYKVGEAFGALGASPGAKGIKKPGDARLMIEKGIGKQDYPFRISVIIILIEYLPGCPDSPQGEARV